MKLTMYLVTLYNASQNNFRVDCSFVPRGSIAAQSTSSQVYFDDIVLYCELKHAKSKALSSTYSQIAKRNNDLLRSQRRIMVCSFISDGQNIRYFQTNNQMVKSSGWLRFLSNSGTNSEVKCVNQ